MKLLILLVGFSLEATASNHFIRPGGTGNGSDWASACADFSGSCAVASLVRGDTYYVASGSYAARAWNRPASGSSMITLQKATTASHGTDFGWSPSFDSGPAVFVGGNTITTPNWNFNGVSEYGFKFDFSEGQSGVKVNGGANGVSLQYIDFDGIPNTGDYNYTASTKGIEIGAGQLFISHCAIHGGESLIQGGGEATTIEYTHMYNARSTSGNFHANVYYLSGGNNGTFRFNRIHNYNAEGLFFTGWNGSPNGWKVYGNVFWSDGGEVYPRGIELRQDYSYSNNEFYNNTFVNLGVGGLLNRAPETGNTCSGCIARDNLSYNSPNTLTGMTVSNNIADGINRFVNLSGKDFRLAAPLAGTALSAPYNVDLTGIARGIDGTWDIGAYEFGGAAQTLQPPTNLTSTVH